MTPIRTLARRTGINRIAPAAEAPAQASGNAALLRHIERALRVAARLARRPVPPELFARFTAASFRLESLAVSDQDVLSALGCEAGRRTFRPPQSLRIRNHVAILRQIERSVYLEQELKLPTVLRWYTSISCGLSIADMDEARIARLEQELRRINSPQLRLQQAVQEIAAVHARLLANPVFPGFNGLLARLLLQYHLARCQLPPVLPDSEIDDPIMHSESALQARLLELLAESCDLLLSRENV
jgi:hypothetical protein